MPLYRELPSGPTKRLSEIVFAGSHDASITTGSAYAQTQDRDIKGQAEAGVRLFDLRILAQRTSQGDNHKHVDLRGYHGSAGGKKTLTATRGNTTYNLETVKSIQGEFGLLLPKMLKQAKKFVTNTNEFLIFKFDKCTNYELIADLCVEILDGNIYTPIAGKAFSQLTLDELGGKVVCVFNEGERQRLMGNREGAGILGFKSLKLANRYDANYSGLQYCGKGGTAPRNVHKNDKAKMLENRDKQLSLMLAMARQEDANAASVLGMMYWTSTGTLSSIQERNTLMWGDSGVKKMSELWTECLKEAIWAQLKRDEVSYASRGGVWRMKAYFPNIIMIDFADPGKCDTIYQLNTVADDRLVKAYRRAQESGKL